METTDRAKQELSQGVATLSISSTSPVNMREIPKSSIKNSSVPRSISPGAYAPLTEVSNSTNCPPTLATLPMLNIAAAAPHMPKLTTSNPARHSIGSFGHSSWNEPGPFGDAAVPTRFPTAQTQTNADIFDSLEREQEAIVNKVSWFRVYCTHIGF